MPQSFLYHCSGGWKSEIKYWPIWFLLRPSSYWFADGLTLPMSSWPFLCSCPKRERVRWKWYLVSLMRTLILWDQGCTFRTSTPSYFLRGPSPNTATWEVRAAIIWILEGHKHSAHDNCPLPQPQRLKQPCLSFALTAYPMEAGGAAHCNACL